MKTKKNLLSLLLFTPFLINIPNVFSASDEIILKGKASNMPIDAKPISSSGINVNSIPSGGDAIIIKGSDKNKPLNLQPNSMFTSQPVKKNESQSKSLTKNSDTDPFSDQKGAIILKGSDKNSNNESSNKTMAKGKVGNVSVSIGSAQNNLAEAQKAVENGNNKSPEIILKGGENNAQSDSRVLHFNSIDANSNQNQNVPEVINSKVKERIPVNNNFNTQSAALPNSPVIANGIPLPSSNVVALPPLPGMIGSGNLPPLPDMTGQVGILHSQPLNPGDFNDQVVGNDSNSPVVFSGKSVQLPPVNSNLEIIEQKWAGLLQNQANMLMQQGAPVKIIIVDSSNFLLRKFILQGLLKGNDSYLSKMDTGLYPVMSQSYINGTITPTCYLMFDQKNIDTLNKQEFIPLSKKAGENATAAFVAGHMAAHCLDQLERSKVIPLKSVWFSNELEQYGVIGAASRRIFGNSGVNSQFYFLKQNDLFKDLGQRQYEERVADSFGLLWALKQSNDSKIIDAVSALRINLPTTSPHNTITTIRNIYTNYKANLDPSLAGLWKQARKTQLQTGISAQLSDGANPSLINSEPKPELSGAVDVKRVDGSYVVGSQYKSKNYTDLDRNGKTATPMQNTKDFLNTSQFNN